MSDPFSSFTFGELSVDLRPVYHSESIVLCISFLRYVFEGLGLVVAVILMNAVPQIHRINEVGVKRICRYVFSLFPDLHQALAGLSDP